MGTVPSLKGLVTFSRFTQGLRPGLKPIPPLPHPISRKNGANWGPRLRGWSLRGRFTHTNSTNC